jgi:hypothetical protein
VPRLGAEDLRVDLQELDAVGPVHVERLAEFAHDLAILRARHAPVHLVQDQDIGALQHGDLGAQRPVGVARVLVEQSHVVGVGLQQLGLVLVRPGGAGGGGLADEGLAIGPQQLDVVEAHAALDVPERHSHRRPEPPVHRSVRPRAAIPRFVADERRGRQAREPRLEGGRQRFRPTEGDELVEREQIGDLQPDVVTAIGLRARCGLCAHRRRGEHGDEDGREEADDTWQQRGAHGHSLSQHPGARLSESCHVGQPSGGSSVSRGSRSRR